MKALFTKSVQIQVIIFFLLFIDTVYPQVQYQVINLGTLGGDYSYAYCINDSGSIVGQTSTAEGSARGFVWQNGTMLNLGTLPNTNSSVARGINNLNQIVGLSDYRSFIMQNGNMTELALNEIYKINDSGQAAGSKVDVNFNIIAVLWHNGNIIELGTLGGDDSQAFDISETGYVVGRSQLPNNSRRAFLWHNGNMINLGTLGDDQSWANSVNDSGHTVGWSTSPATVRTPLLWKNNSIINLITLGGIGGSAYGINNEGKIVGFSTDINENLKACLWENGSIVNLNSVSDTSGGWELKTAFSINNSGQIAGYGTYNGATRAFLLNPQNLNIINPSQSAVWIAGEKDTIKWSGGRANQTVNIYLSTNYENGNGTFNSIVQNYPADSGKYIWTIPNTILSRKCAIKIEDVSDTSNNVKSNVFRIKPYVLTRINPADSSYYEYRKDRDQWGFRNTLNDMWPAGWWLQFNYNGTDPFINSQYSQWQADEAFKSANHATHSDWVSWVNTFSVDACYYSTSLGIYKSAAVLAWRSSGGAWGGSCFGIAVANALAFSYKDNFQYKYPNFPAFLNPITVVSDTGVKRVVNELFTHQFGNPHQTIRTNVGLQKTPKQTLVDLSEMFREENADIKTLSFLNTGPGGGGHAILAYGLEKDGANPNIFHIKVYDNSYPNSNNRITIDTSANGGNGGWVNPNWPGWGGNKWIYLRNPTLDYLTNPTIAKGTSQQSPFIISGTELQVFNAISATIRIVDNSGNTTGFYNNLIQTEVPESVPFVVDNGSETPPYGYSLPTDNYSIVLNEFAEDTVETFFFTGNKSFVYERTGATQSQTDKLFFDGGVSVVNPDAQSKTIELLNLINETSQEKLFVLRSLNLVQNDSVKIENPDSNKVKLVSYGSAKEYDIELNYVTETGVGRFGDFSIQLTANTSHTFVPDWTGLTNSQLLVLVDVGNNGTIDDTLSLKNEVTGIKDEGSLLSPDSYNLAQNYPNPFNPVTTIQYSIPNRSSVTLKIYDVLGKEIATLVNEEKDRGLYSVNFDASGLASGIYLYRLQAGSFVETKKMILLK